MAARRRGGATNRGAGKRKSTGNIGSPHWTGAGKKQRVPRAWPWCDETKSMARERRATWGRLAERAGERGSEDSRGRGCEGSTALARGAATLVAHR